MPRRVSSKVIAYKRHTLKRDRNQCRIALLPQINRAEADVREMYLSTTDGRSEEGRRGRVGDAVALRLDHVTVYRPRFFFRSLAWPLGATGAFPCICRPFALDLS